jgi:aryl-alcohol dehydrogenase-like predicted oxidoreductase
MEFRRLGMSGLTVPALSFGTGSFAPKAIFPKGIDTALARSLIDRCLDAGLNMFDSADSYFRGQSERILGEALQGRRDKVLISTKSGQPAGDGPNDIGASRFHLTETIHASLKRLNSDYIDLFQLHTFDAATPVEETLATLDDFVRAGKIRYIGASNFAGWQLMKSVAASERHHYARYVVHQAYYSLVGRDFEWELMPFGLDQGVGTAVWSPLGWGRLTGKLRRGQPLPAESRLQYTAAIAPRADDEILYRVVDVLDEIAEETGKLIPQIALNWLLQRPTVSTVIIGARTEQQLEENLGAVGWALSAEQVARLDAASATLPSYPTSFYSEMLQRHRNPGAA